ncbi:MAG: hypothetical protein G01um101429_572 [Parcubacteria group bacterium Gr01-1014_29]|nr:MAG: hypothetical protein G01um101429_572 [Parcubacteria group bacterium Gr01-1014_29]
MSNPFSQARQLMQLVEDQELDVGELQVLYNSGHLSRLFRAAKHGDLSRVNVEELERILGFDPPVFLVKMGVAETTDEVVAYLKANGFNYVHRYITQENFPLKSSKTPWEDEIKIIDPDRMFYLDECPGILSAAGLLVPTYEHSIRFAQQHGKTTTSIRKPFIIFPHKPWQDPNHCRCVVSLNRSPNNRGLDLSYSTGQRFNDSCVMLAGVQPRKQSLVG